VGFAFASLDECCGGEEKRGGHPQPPGGIKGAQAVAAAIFLARTGKSKEDMKHYIEEWFDYDLGEHWRQCARTTPSMRLPGFGAQSITAFLESNDFEDAIGKL